MERRPESRGPGLESAEPTDPEGRGDASPDGPQPPPGSPASPERPEPLRSVHTSNFPAILQELGVSILVTTYQAGRLVMLRADGDRLNTHFRSFNRPMGLAAQGGRLALGTSLEIWEFHDAPAVARLLEPPGSHDACYLPRSSVCTGDVRIHEMAWSDSREEGPELWFVNTRFSCLCTRSDAHSFVPRWRPPFISELAPEDRCHLNGLGMADGRPSLATALGASDEPNGWRADKRGGGVLLDIPSGEVIARGLSMPHSPRWHDGRLWVLESGRGGVGCVDPATGKYEALAELPGFTRGLDFHGPLAFVGLSQVRESAVFSGFAVADRPLEERCCGVWVLDVESGRTVAFVKFEDALQEIFAVQVLPGVRRPDVVNDRTSLIADSFIVPDGALGLVPDPMRHPA